MSRGGEFLYVVTLGAMSTSNATACRLVAINMLGSTANAGNNPLGHVVDRAFAPTPPHRVGFLPIYFYAPNYAIISRFQPPGQATVRGLATMAKDTGVVMWAGAQQADQDTRGTSTTSTFVSGNPFETTSNTFVSGIASPSTMSANGQIWGFASDIGGPIQRLTQPGLSFQNTAFTQDMGGATMRRIRYMISDRQGSRVAYLFDDANGNDNAIRNDREGIGYVGGIAFNPQTGALAATPSGFIVEGRSNNEMGITGNTTLGRAGDRMAFDSTGLNLFYAFGANGLGTANGGDENLKAFVASAINIGTGQAVPRRLGTGDRLNVLKAGR